MRLGYSIDRWQVSAIDRFSGCNGSFLRGLFEKMRDPMMAWFQ